MLTEQDLFDIAKSRFVEATILLREHKPDGAVYLVGYALELMLKRRIVKTLDWDGYPETKKEFKDYRSFKVHDLDVLLRLSGIEKKVKADTTAWARWQIAHTWNSEIRYKAVNTLSDTEGHDIIEATRYIINQFLQK